MTNNICPAALLYEVTAKCNLPAPQFTYWYYTNKKVYQCDVSLNNIKYSGFGLTPETARYNGAVAFINNILPNINNCNCVAQIKDLAIAFKLPPPEFWRSTTAMGTYLVSCKFMNVITKGIGLTLEAAEQNATSDMLNHIKINNNIVSLEREFKITKKVVRQGVDGNCGVQITRMITEEEIDKITVRSDLETMFKEFNISYDLEIYDTEALFKGRNCPISRYCKHMSGEEAEIMVLKYAIKAIIKLVH